MSRTLTGWSFWGTRGSRGTEAPARQPGTRVNPLQRAGPIRVRAEIPSVTRKRAFLNHAEILASGVSRSWSAGLDREALGGNDLHPRLHWYLHNSQFFVTCSVARDWAAFNGGGSLVNFSVTMDRPQCEGPPHNEGSGEISTRAEGVVAHGVILLLHVDLENRIPRGLTLT